MSEIQQEVHDWATRHVATKVQQGSISPENRRTNIDAEVHRIYKHLQLIETSMMTVSEEESQQKAIAEHVKRELTENVFPETNEKIDAQNELRGIKEPEIEPVPDTPVVKEALPEPKNIPKALKSDGFKQDYVEGGTRSGRTRQILQIEKDNPSYAELYAVQQQLAREVIHAHNKWRRTQN